MITGNDIIYVYSGGATNSTPELSLGGDPSSYQIFNGINNLFNDVGPETAKAGLIDYRCFYVFNNHATDSYYDGKFYLESEAPEDEMSFGVVFRNEVQSITVVGNITGGSVILMYDTFNVTWNYTTDIATNAYALATALNGLAALSGVTAGASQQVYDDLPAVVYEVTFTGEDGNRYHPLVTVVTNNLIGQSTVTIAKLADGSPINSIANEIDVPTTIPFGITFTKPTVSTPFAIGTLKATEGFPVWSMRQIVAGTVDTAQDSFKVRFRGTPI